MTAHQLNVTAPSRFTRLPHETVRQQVLNLEQKGVVAQRDGGKVIDLNDLDRVTRWLDFQARTKVSTRQIVWKLYRAGVIVHTPSPGTALHPLEP